MELSGTSNTNSHHPKKSWQKLLISQKIALICPWREPGYMRAIFYARTGVVAPYECLAGETLYFPEMIDTIGIEIDLDPIRLVQIEKKLITYLKLDRSTGETEHCFTKGQLSGSYDYRISMMVKDKRWVTQQRVEIVGRIQQKSRISGRKTVHNFTREKNIPVLTPCPPFLYIEFSLPKWAVGVNFLNSTMDEDWERLLHFRCWLEKMFKTPLPPIQTWRLSRVDLGINLQTIDSDHVDELILNLKRYDYPRREKGTGHHYSSLFFSGSETYFKIYNKFHEFFQHDRKRLRKLLPDVEYAEMIHQLTDGIIRLETGIRKRKLISMGVETLPDLLLLDSENILKGELMKLTAGVKSHRFNTNREVMAILKNAPDDIFKNTSRTTVMAVWKDIILEGKKKAKSFYGRNKYYRVVAVLKTLNISFNSNVIKRRNVKKIKNDFDLFAFNFSDQKKKDRYNEIIFRAGQISQKQWFTELAA